jgi:hypothetical protein
MSADEERTLAVWRVEAREVLAHAARARGLDGLRRVMAFKRLLNVVGDTDVEQALLGVSKAPTDAEVDALAQRALRLVGEYPRLKALAVAQESKAPDPARPAPSRPYAMDHLADPLFVREATAPRQKLRDLGSEEAVAKIRERQEAALTAFFAAEPTEGKREHGPDGWSAWFELGDDLEIVTRPLVGLPSFVKALDVCAGEARTMVLAGNLRSGACRTKVAPSTEGYRFSAGDFDEDVGEELRALSLPGFLLVCATAFRVDATGRGQRMEGAALSPGRVYRLLVPPGIPVPAARSLSGEGGAWQVVDLEIPSTVPQDLHEMLSRLGLTVAKMGIDVGLVGVAARDYRVGRGGERYPCFGPDDRPVLHVAGVDAKVPGDLVLFLEGPEGQHRFELGPGSDHFVALGPLAEGRYALDVLTRDPGRTPERLFFEIDASAGGSSASGLEEATVTIRDHRVVVDGDTNLETDLSDIDEGSLSITAPPLFCVGVRWEGARSRPFPPLYPDARGEVPARTLLALSERERTTEGIGDLVLDFGHFGRLVVRHTRPLSLDLVCERLRALWAERGTLAREEEDATLLATAWIEPVCAALGYRLREAAALADSGSAVLSAFGLETTFRDGERIATERPAGLLCVRRGADLRATGAGSVREAAFKLAVRDGHARVVLTDGVLWALWERGRSFAAEPLDASKALGEGGRAEAMVERFHA